MVACLPIIALSLTIHAQANSHEAKPEVHANEYRASAIFEVRFDDTTQASGSWAGEVRDGDAARQTILSEATKFWNKWSGPDPKPVS